MSKHRPIHRGHHRGDCRVSDALLSQLIQPNPADAQREAFRETTRAAMLREFDRASAPVREVPQVEPEEPKDNAQVLTVEGITLASLEPIKDPFAAAAQVRSIISRHRTTTR